MIKASFSLTETGSVRTENQDHCLLDTKRGIFAVADGLGGLPNGARASRLTLDILRKELDAAGNTPLHETIANVNDATRDVGFGLDEAGFGSTLTMARYFPEKRLLEIAHVGDSAAYLVHRGEARLLTVEHTVAARMVAERWEDASEAIPLTAHHTLTQCIGQDLYIDPQVVEVPIQPGDRFFLFTDGITKAMPEEIVKEAIRGKGPLDRICQILSFRVEAAGSPDNYTIVAVEF
ncbi:MAG: PP2C family protein-serine/threonine phosphatase [Oceanipulchritudo sp.]